MTDKPRGRCPVCRFNGRLRTDGTLYRHWSFSPPGEKGYCPGWKQRPDV